jgi:hypothetical protein
LPPVWLHFTISSLPDQGVSAFDHAALRYLQGDALLSGGQRVVVGGMQGFL